MKNLDIVKKPQIANPLNRQLKSIITKLHWVRIVEY